MSQKILSFGDKRIEEMCRPVSLKTLFKEYAVVLAGDELGAFCLDKWAILNGPCGTSAAESEKDCFYLWDRRQQYGTNVSYMELVYAAFEEGVRDVVIDMAPAMQPGINAGLQHYREACGEQAQDDPFLSFLKSALTTPMDAVVRMAGVLDMKVHAVNSGLSGIATLFREACGVTTVPKHLSEKERVEVYMADGFEQDKLALARILRREPAKVEVETLRDQMLLRLSDRGPAIEKGVFDERPTIQTIRETTEDRPFLGLFQNGRLFRSPEDLDGGLRSVYGNGRVARVSMHVPEGEEFPKHPQYSFHYSMKACTVSMTEDYAREKYRNNFESGPR